MLPAPFYTEVPADLGDDQTWACQAGACGPEDALVYPPVQGLSGSVVREVVAGAVMLLTRLRALLDLGQWSGQRC